MEAKATTKFVRTTPRKMRRVVDLIRGQHVVEARRILRFSPLGGGEGKSSGGRHPTSPWGKKEGRTRKKKKPSNKDIVRRRGKGRG